jgi:hypothetical protein
MNDDKGYHFQQGQFIELVARVNQDLSVQQMAVHVFDKPGGASCSC